MSAGLSFLFVSLPTGFYAQWLLPSHMPRSRHNRNNTRSIFYQRGTRGFKMVSCLPPRVYPKVNKRCGGSGLVHETRTYPQTYIFNYIVTYGAWLGASLTSQQYRSNCHPTSSLVFPFMLSKLLFGSRIGSRFSAWSTAARQRLWLPNKFDSDLNFGLAICFNTALRAEIIYKQFSW